MPSQESNTTSGLSMDDRSRRSPETTLCATTNWVGSNSSVEKKWMFFWAASFENRACWNTSLSGYDRVEMWTVSPDVRRRAISSSAAVVLPVPVSPFTRSRRLFRSSNFCNSGGKGISEPAPRSSFNIRSPELRDVRKLRLRYITAEWSNVFYCVHVRCYRPADQKVDSRARENGKRTRMSEARRRGNAGCARRRPVGPTPTLSVAHLRTVQSGWGECSLCLRCHRTARSALQAESSEPRETRGRRVTRPR